MAKEEAHKLIKDLKFPGGITFRKGVTAHILEGPKVAAYIASGHIAPPKEKKEETK